MTDTKRSAHTPGPWTLTPDDEQHNPYWYGAKLDAPDKLVVRLEMTNAHGQGEANARLIAAAAVGLDSAERVYLALLRHPHDAWRVRNQEAYCLLRDFIAEATGRTAEDVQTSFEERAFTGQ